MTETAHERLATIAQHTDLGSGMQIALKDLEIRGAGNLLGGEQSGHIADVGFDLYVRLVGEALAEYKGESAVEHAEMRVELPIEAHIPHDYIAHERLRLEAYKRLADAMSNLAVDEVFADVDQVAADREVVDRAAVILRIDDRRRLCRETRQILRHGDAAQIMLAEKGLERDGRGDLAGPDELGRHLEHAAVQFLREMLRLEEVGDAVEGIVVDEDRAQQRLLCLHMVGLHAVGRFRLVRRKAKTARQLFDS